MKLSEEQKYELQALAENTEQRQALEKLFSLSLVKLEQALSQSATEDPQELLKLKMRYLGATQLVKTVNDYLFKIKREKDKENAKS